MGIRVLAGYPQQVGEKIEAIVDIDGPSSYGNTGTFATSGQQINASDFGLGGFEMIGTDNLSADGVNAVQIVLGATVAGTKDIATAPPAGSPGDVAKTAVIHWYTTPASSAEVANGTNLSGKYVRLQIRGV